MTLLYLIRHARSTWNAEGRAQGHADPPLDAVGLRQAQALAEHLQSEMIHAIYSSPLARARQTAEIIAAPHGLPVRLDDRLKERDLGEWTGLMLEEAKVRYPDWGKVDWRIEGAPGGEDEAVLTARTAAVFADILTAHPEEAVAVVSHGGTLNACLAHLLGLPRPRAVSFSFHNAALARLKVQDGRVHVLSLGDDRHL